MNNASFRRWAVEEFGGARLVDSRWRSRLLSVAARAARQPAGRISEVFTNAAERQGAYGLLEQERVAPGQLAEAMFAACARRCATEPFVFIPLDGSSLTLTDKEANKFGAIGTAEGGARGIKVISALCVSPAGVPLGLGSQTWWTRPDAPAELSYELRPTEQKETRHWLTTMSQARECMRREAPKTRCWFQLDREGDAWPILMQADAEGHWFTIRGSHNRRVLDRRGGKTYLRSVLEKQGAGCTYQLPVSAGPKRTARMANMIVRACSVTFDLRDRRASRWFTKDVNAVWAREICTTPSGEAPLEWLLLTNHSIESAEEIARIVYGYSQRWRIEDFHRTWKRGACRVEETQLRSTGATIKWATVLAAVAVRIERLKHLSRSEPQRPGTDEFSAIELKAIVLLRFEDQPKKRPPPDHVPTIGEATQWLAEIGGYTGKSSGGPPGSTVLARGLKQVQTAVRTLRAVAADL